MHPKQFWSTHLYLCIPCQFQCFFSNVDTFMGLMMGNWHVCAWVETNSLQGSCWCPRHGKYCYADAATQRRVQKMWRARRGAPVSDMEWRWCLVIDSYPGPIYSCSAGSPLLVHSTHSQLVPPDRNKWLIKFRTAEEHIFPWSLLLMYWTFLGGWVFSGMRMGGWVSAGTRLSNKFWLPFQAVENTSVVADCASCRRYLFASPVMNVNQLTLFLTLDLLKIMYIDWMGVRALKSSNMFKSKLFAFCILDPLNPFAAKLAGQRSPIDKLSQLHMPMYIPNVWMCCCVYRCLCLYYSMNLQVKVPRC